VYNSKIDLSEAKVLFYDIHVYLLIDTIQYTNLVILFPVNLFMLIRNIGLH